MKLRSDIKDSIQLSEHTSAEVGGDQNSIAEYWLLSERQEPIFGNA
jgi:hypothetical protein